VNLKKQDLIQTTFNGRDSKLVGKWRGNLVFSPVGSDEDECLVYTPNEVAELLETGEFRRVGRAFFGRKLANLDELREYTKASIYSASAGQPYTVVKEIYLDSQDFEALSRDFFDDQPWLSKEDGGVTRDGKIHYFTNCTNQPFPFFASDIKPHLHFCYLPFLCGSNIYHSEAVK
jgi:hypothetical protein